jgi:hypothetical protein
MHDWWPEWTNIDRCYAHHSAEPVITQYDGERCRHCGIERLKLDGVVNLHIVNKKILRDEPSCERR